MKGWVGLVGWPIADGLPTWSPISYRSSARQGKFAGQRPTFYHCATQPNRTVPPSSVPVASTTLLLHRGKISAIWRVLKCLFIIMIIIIITVIITIKLSLFMNEERMRPVADFSRCDSYPRRHSRRLGRTFNRVCLSVCLSALQQENGLSYQHQTWYTYTL